MEELDGLEPTNESFADSCLTNLATAPSIFINPYLVLFYHINYISKRQDNKIKKHKYSANKNGGDDGN